MDDTVRTDLSFTRGEEEGAAETAAELTENPLPRAVMRPNSHWLLDGEWRFALDPEDRGMRERWYLGHTYERAAQWPGSIEEHMEEAREAKEQHPANAPAAAWQDKVVAWYEREFPLPERHGPGPQPMLQITFGACGYETRVWLNGRALRTIEGEKTHYGEYTSFSYELPEDALRLFNRITVRISDTMDAEIPRGKQQSSVYKRGGIWYQTFTGAVRSVWLEAVERNRLRSRVGVVSVVEDRLVRFNFTTLIHDPGVYTLRVRVFERGRRDAEPLAEGVFPLRLLAGEKQQRVVVEVPGARLWGPGEPNLYRLVAGLEDEWGHEAQIETLFGLRKVEARGRYVYLNNQPTYLDGILYQPGASTYDEMRRHMRAMGELGCNLVRVHIAGIDPRIYDLADELGLLLWVEVPSPHSSSQRSRENHWAEMMRMLVHTGTHPSVVIWSLYNEDWGAQDIAHSEDTRKYIAHAYDYMRLNRPELLVVDNDGWHHVSVEGRLKSDLLTAHLYTPDVGRWGELLDKLEEGKNEGVAVNPLIVGDPYYFCGQIPLVVSEWGGFGFSDYGGPAESGDKAARIRAFKRELRRRRIAGDVYTQATSIEDEDNGLIDPGTGELGVPPGLLDSRGLSGEGS